MKKSDYINEKKEGLDCAIQMNAFQVSDEHI